MFQRIYVGILKSICMLEATRQGSEMLAYFQASHVDGLGFLAGTMEFYHVLQR